VLSGLVLVLVGVVAGVVTTIAGAGGGVMLVLALGAITSPHAALAVTSPALFASNLHRAWMFRASVDRPVAARFLAGALPATLGGAVVASRIPEVWVRVAIVVITVLAVLRALRLFEARVSCAGMVASSAAIGLLSAGAGAAGFLVAPLVMAAGLSGSAYVATIAICGTALHAGRVVGYAIGGLLTTAHLAHSVWLVAGLMVGNALGKRLRTLASARVESAVEIGAVVVCSVLAVAGVM
jgi:uncharacterized membrane protein YfcA